MVAGEVGDCDCNCTIINADPRPAVPPPQFVEVYSNPSEQASWDAVATCFFLDTARNVVRYLEVLNFVLPLGGIWINVGPLLWHYENNSRGETSVELTLEEVCDLVGKMGFQIEVGLPREL